MWGESGVCRAGTSDSVCNEEDIAKIKKGLCLCADFSSNVVFAL